MFWLDTAKNLIVNVSQCHKTAHTTTCRRQCCTTDALDKIHNLRAIHRSHFENLFDCEKLDLYVKVESR